MKESGHRNETLLKNPKNLIGPYNIRLSISLDLDYYPQVLVQHHYDFMRLLIKCALYGLSLH